MANLIPTLKYLWLTLRHKVFVFQAGSRTGAPAWRLIIHDWSKFTLAEAPHYGRQFFGDQGDALGFSYAWLHHQRNNPHHWEYWVPVTGHNRGGFNDLEPLPMPDWAVREMVADWMGATRAYQGAWPTAEWPWLLENWPKIAHRMHPFTRHKVVTLVKDVTGTVISVHAFPAEMVPIVRFDDGVDIYLSSYAGGADPKGEFSRIGLMRCNKQGEQTFRTFVAVNDWGASGITSDNEPGHADPKKGGE